MQRVELDSEEWGRIMSIIASAPWNVANPLLMKIGAQLRDQSNSGRTMEDIFKETAAAQAQVGDKTAN